MDDLYFKEYAYAISVVFSGPNLDLVPTSLNPFTSFVSDKPDC
jgi:hypothetical protein